MDRNLKRLATQPDLDWDDGEDMDQLYRRHASWLGGMLRRRFGQGLDADADDVVQETYARLAPHAVRDIRRPRALLMRVASNLAKDILRRREVRGRHAKAVRDEPEGGVTGEAALELLAAKEVILSIPEAYRDVFVLSRFHGLTYEEIATRCGLSVKSVEWRLSKAIAHCVKHVKD